MRARTVGGGGCAGYDAPFPVPEAKAGALALPRAGADRARASEQRRRCSRSATRSKAWEKPALVLFGDSDPIFPPPVADAIARHIPGALPAETVANAGHFVQEDAGEEVAARIVRFLEES